MAATVARAWRARVSFLTADRLERFPEQGAYVRMVEPPEPWMSWMTDWRFLVVRKSWRTGALRLRADYKHTPGAAGCLELKLDDVWFRRELNGPRLASFFEAA
jgi:hypothetical protein